MLFLGLDLLGFCSCSSQRVFPISDLILFQRKWEFSVDLSSRSGLNPRSFISGYVLEPCVWFDWLPCWFWVFFSSLLVSIFELFGLSSNVVPGYKLFRSFSITLKIWSRSYLPSDSIYFVNPTPPSIFGWRFMNMMCSVSWSLKLWSFICIGYLP